MTARPSMGLRVAMALYADVTYDSRVQREAETLCRSGHSVTIHCLSGAVPAGSSFTVRAATPTASTVLPDGSSPFLVPRTSSWLGQFASRMRWMVGYLRNLRAWGRWTVAAAADVDVWHVHDLTALLAVGPLVKAPALLVYDSHEIFMETGSAARLPGLLRGALSAYERRLARRAVALVTVNDGFAEVLNRRLRPRRIHIVRNCPPRWTPTTPQAPRLRHSAGVPASVPMILYHGSFTRDRGIEQLAEAMLEPGLESAHLALLGFGRTQRELENLARDPRFGGRLHVLNAVAPGELLEWVVGADVDVMAFQSTSLQHRLATPNKLWESLAAGVPVVVSDFPGMRQVVFDDGLGALGAVCDPADPASIAAAIRTIVELPPRKREALRNKCLEAAHSRWNWEQEGATLVQLYGELDRAG